jgi:NAD(P)-dependent dehydrogenase (short-subunit alcohol dehydrogenase family)
LWDSQIEEAARKRGVPVDDYLKQRQLSIPLGDFILPEDIAAAVAFLADEESRFITGSKFIIDGGFFHCDTYRGDLAGNQSATSGYRVGT